MADVEVYSGFLCGYCFAAKRLLRRKGVEFREFNVSLRPGRRMEMMERAGGRQNGFRGGYAMIDLTPEIATSPFRTRFLAKSTVSYGTRTKNRVYGRG